MILLGDDPSLNRRDGYMAVLCYDRFGFFLFIFKIPFFFQAIRGGAN